MGRVNDVVNGSGYRLSTAEVERALVRHPQVAEAAVADPGVVEALVKGKR